MLSRQKVRRRLHHWQRRLTLDHWSIRAKFEPKRPEGGDAANVDVHNADWRGDYCECVVYFDLLKIPERALDSYIIHELCHVAPFWPVHALADTWATNKRMRRTLERAGEQSAVMLERILCRAFGVTPWNDLAEEAA